MKIKVTMKDPDTLQDAIQEAVVEHFKALGICGDELEAVAEKRTEKVSALAEEWFRYGECLTVEIDADARACVVLRMGDT